MIPLSHSQDRHGPRYVTHGTRREIDVCVDAGGSELVAEIFENAGDW